MATQGLVSICSQGKVLMKIIAGCDGYNSTRLASFIRRCWPMRPEDVYAVALDTPFGCQEDLVVITPDQCVFQGDGDLHARYRETLHNPKFNPRWESGITEHLTIVTI